MQTNDSLTFSSHLIMSPDPFTSPDSRHSLSVCEIIINIHLWNDKTRSHPQQSESVLFCQAEWPNVTFTKSKLFRLHKHLPDLEIIHVKSLLHNIINVSSADKMSIENSTKVWSECFCLSDWGANAWRINNYKRWARLVSSPSLCCTNNIYNHIHFLSFMMNVCMCVHGHFEGC